MRIHPMEVQLCLKFSDEEKQVMAPSFMFGDAEEQLSYAVHRFGSERVTTLIVDAKNGDIAALALAEVDGFSEADKVRLGQILGR